MNVLILPGMEELFQYGWSGIRKFLRENKVALLYTLIFHLVVLIIFIFLKVEGLKKDQELGIALEFEEKTIEQLLAEEELEVPPEWIEEILRQRELSSNRAVNLNAEDKLTEEISTSDYVNDLLEQIEEARNQEDRERLEELQAILASADYVPPSSETEDESGVYTGPTTITFEFLEEPLNRGKVELTVPVYRCEGAGDVKVEVIVAPDGNVREARVLEPIIGSDKVCFSEAARAAALSSQFRIELSGPAKHRAIISYSFIAQ
jgi:hypothetical protein